VEVPPSESKRIYPTQITTKRMHKLRKKSGNQKQGRLGRRKPSQKLPKGEI